MIPSSPHSRPRRRRVARTAWLMAAWLAAGLSAWPDLPAAPMPGDHGAHQGGSGEVDTRPDALGRQLYAAPHAMTAAGLAELRQRVPSMAQLDDAAMMRLMDLMGPDYTWSLTDSTVRGTPGVLLLAHGFREQGDRDLHARLRPLLADSPASLALGMSMMSSAHIQLAADNLVAAGARDILVLPVASSRHSTLLRQWQYVFGLHDTPEYATVPRIDTPARIVFLEPLEDHPLVVAMVRDHADQISEEPAREELFIVAHGPIREADNQLQLAALERLASALAAERDFAAIHVATLQDDAEPAVRRANVARLRDRITAAERNGHSALVVTNLLSSRTVQSQLRRDLRGLDYRFNPRGLSEHEGFLQWIEASINEAAASLRD